MASRLELHEELCTLLGSRNVYYNPPESVRMLYPAIRYSKTGMYTLKANDRLYKKDNQYQAIIIDPNPDSDIPDKCVEHFPMCSFGGPYVVDGLNHFPLTIYY